MWYGLISLVMWMKIFIKGVLVESSWQISYSLTDWKRFLQTEFQAKKISIPVSVWTEREITKLGEGKKPYFEGDLN